MSTATMNRRDKAIANETTAASGFACIANGCPSRWSVDAGHGRLCSAHAWAARHDWPAITQQQLDADADRARWHGRITPAAPALPDVPRLRRELNRLVELMRSRTEHGLPAEHCIANVNAAARRAPLTQAQIDIRASCLRMVGRTNQPTEEMP